MDALVRIIICLSLVTVLSCSKKTYSTEHESNETFETATPIDVDQTMQGYLSTASDIDFFSIDIAEPLRFEISLSAIKGVNNSINIYNEDKKMIKSVDDNRKSSSERISNIWFGKGKYYICVTHGDRDERKGNEEDPYRVLINLVDQDLTQEKEPNDSFDSGNNVEIDKSITGYFSPSMNKHNSDPRYGNREVDWYTFVIPVDDGIQKTYDILLNGVKGVTSELALYNSENTLIMKTESGGQGQPADLKNCTLKNGVYHICISAKNYETNPTEKYTLALTSKITDSAHESEPNNSEAEGNLIDGDSIKGTLHSDTDRDFFIMKSDTKSVIRLELSFDEVISSNIRIYDQNSNIINEYKGNERTIVIPSVVVKDKTVIEISGSDKNKSEKSYGLSILKSPISGNIEEEPNNDLKHSQLISGELTGYTNSKKDKDYYRIEIPERQKKRISFTGIKNGKLTISVTDPDGYIIRSKKVISDQTISITETIDKTGYIIIESIKENQISPYTMQIEDYTNE